MRRLKVAGTYIRLTSKQEDIFEDDNVLGFEVVDTESAEDYKQAIVKLHSLLTDILVDKGWIQK